MGRFLADGRGRASICQRGQGPKESASHRMVKFSRGNSQGPGGYRDFNPCVSHHAPPRGARRLRKGLCKRASSKTCPPGPEPEQAPGAGACVTEPLPGVQASIAAVTDGLGRLGALRSWPPASLSSLLERGAGQGPLPFSGQDPEPPHLVRRMATGVSEPAPPRRCRRSWSVQGTTDPSPLFALLSEPSRPRMQGSSCKQTNSTPSYDARGVH